MEVKEYLFKILVVGDVGTGKTSIIKRYVHNIFIETYKATIGVDFALKVIQWDSEVVIRLQLWDIAGQERFGNMTRVYYKEAMGAILVYDMGRKSTFDAIDKWKSDIDSKVVLPNGQSIPVVLFANKCDTVKEKPSKAEMDEFCENKRFIGWFETSAKENTNIDKGCRFLVSSILESNIKLEEEKDLVRLEPEQNPAPKTCC